MGMNSGMVSNSCSISSTRHVHRHLFHSKNICPLLFHRGHIFFEWNKCLCHAVNFDLIYFMYFIFNGAFRYIIIWYTYLCLLLTNIHYTHKHLTIIDLNIFNMGLGWLCLTPISVIFQLYYGSQFIDGGNLSTPRKPPNCRKSLTNFIT